MIKLKLSNFLQAKFNIFLYMSFGWGLARIYIFLLGWIYFRIRKDEKQIIEKSVAKVVTMARRDRERKEIMKKVISGILSHYYEKLYIAFEDKNRATLFLNRNVAAENISTIKSALNKGRGVILITGHYGAIEYIPTLLAVNDISLSMIAKFNSVQLREKIFKQADKYGIRMIDADTKGNVLSKAINELRENRVLVTQCDEFDEWRPSENRKITFLGQVTGLDRTINILHKRTGAELVFGVLHRNSLTRYSFIVYSHEQMLEMIPSVRSKTAGEMVLKVLEQFIIRFPEQWYQWKKYPELCGSQQFSVNSTGNELPRPILLPLLETNV
jgi:Kdo2-lipid IVA lauroyltransferase/acyltransferase